VPPENDPAARATERRRRRHRVWMLALLLALGSAFLIWQKNAGVRADGGSQPPAGQQKGGRGGKNQAAAAAPVVAARSHKGNIGVYYLGLGTVTPIYTVTVRSRVDGELMKVYYQEGDMVQAGQLLVEIDPRPYQVQLEQAEGQLARDQATLANAHVDLARYQKLLQQNAVQEQTYATQQATVGQLEGTVKSDQGAVDAAKLNLVYCKITSPITGRIGLRLVDPGNIIHATDTNGLLVITQIQPISVLFTISEDQLQAVLRRLAGHERLRAYAYDRENQNRIAAGMLATVDNQIDPSTGTLRLRAVFENQDQRMYPNQFVNIRLLVQEKTGVVLVPTAAIQRTTTREFVYLVKPDSSVTVRPITEGVTQDDETEITSGLSEGDVVVLTGVDRLQEGSKVKAQIAEQGSAAGGGKRK